MFMLANCSYFDPPTQGTVFWQATRNYVELLSGVLLLKFLVCNALKYLEPGALVQKALRNWFATTEQALGLTGLLIAQPDGSGESELGNSGIPKDQHNRPAEAKDKRYTICLYGVSCSVVIFILILYSGLI
jgi:E3 ubiquitin-protein ligase MARCH6